MQLNSMRFSPTGAPRFSKAEFMASEQPPARQFIPAIRAFIAQPDKPATGGVTLISALRGLMGEHPADGLLKQKTMSLLPEGDVLKSVSLKPYGQWLLGYLEQGKDARVDDEFSTTRPVYVAQRDFQLPPGQDVSQGLDIIVPKGVTVTHGALGYHQLFWMDGFRYEGSFTPRVYKDFRPSLQRP